MNVGEMMQLLSNEDPSARLVFIRIKDGHKTLSQIQYDDGPIMDTIKAYGSDRTLDQPAVVFAAYHED